MFGACAKRNELHNNIKKKDKFLFIFNLLSFCGFASKKM